MPNDALFALTQLRLNSIIEVRQCRALSPIFPYDHRPIIRPIGQNIKCRNPRATITHPKGTERNTFRAVHKTITVFIAAPRQCENRYQSNADQRGERPRESCRHLGNHLNYFDKFHLYSISALAIYKEENYLAGGADKEQHIY